MFFTKKNKSKKEDNCIEKFPNEINIKNKIYNIKIKFSTKKSSSVAIKEDSIIFRLSNLLSEKKCKEHFEILLKKVSNKIKKNNYSQNSVSFKEVLKRGYFKFNNKLYYIENKKIRGVQLKDETFYYDFEKDYNLEKLKKAIIKLLIYEYEGYVYNYLTELNESTYRYNITGFHLNDVTSKWGHCTYDNKIMLNLKLLNTKREIMDYVIMHELSHIKYKNHSKEFWKEVEKYCPNYKELKKELKNNPPNIFQ